MIFAQALRGLIQGGEAVVNAALGKVFDEAASAASLIPLAGTRAAALKLIADGRVNLLKAFDQAADDAGEVAAAFVDDVTTAFANAAQAVDDGEKLEAAATAAIAQIQTLLGQHKAGLAPLAGQHTVKG